MREALLRTFQKKLGLKSKVTESIDSECIANSPEELVQVKRNRFGGREEQTKTFQLWKNTHNDS